MSYASASNRLRRAIARDKGDDLERARAAFRSLNSTQMQQQYGQSGKSCEEILAGYEQGRQEWQEASDLLALLLSD